MRLIDLSQPLGDNIFAEIEHAYNEYGVIFFRNQRITPEQQIRFSRRFGGLEASVLKQYLLAGHPEIVVLSNITEGGRPTGTRPGHAVRGPRLGPQRARFDPPDPRCA